MSAIRGKGCTSTAGAGAAISAELQKLTPKHHQHEKYRVQNLNDFVEKAPALVVAKRWIVLPGTVFSLLVATLVLPVSLLEEVHEQGGKDDAHCDIEDHRDAFQHVILDVGSQLFREDVNEAPDGVAREKHAEEAAAREGCCKVPERRCRWWKVRCWD